MSEILSIYDHDTLSKHAARTSTGQAGEEIAANYLVEKGYQLVVANFKVPIGRNRVGTQVSGEIDLVALEGDVLCFIEVKTRSSSDFALPLANVDVRKQRQITRTARIYRRIFRVADMPYRFDAVSVVTGKKPKPEVELFRGYWSESKFRKKIWNDHHYYPF